MTVIQDRGYVHQAETRLRPTDLGFIVCDALVDTFSDIMDVAYTAGMEAQLDRVAGGECPTVRCWGPFTSALPRSWNRPAPPCRGRGAGAPRRAARRPGRAHLPAMRPAAPGARQRRRALSGLQRLPRVPLRAGPGQPRRPGEAQAQFAEGETCELCGGRMKIITAGRSPVLGVRELSHRKNTRPILSERIKQLAAETACRSCGQKPLTPAKGRFGEYLRCPRCEVNYSLSKLGLARAAGPRRRATATPRRRKQRSRRWSCLPRMRQRPWSAVRGATAPTIAAGLQKERLGEKMEPFLWMWPAAPTRRLSGARLWRNEKKPAHVAPASFMSLWNRRTEVT